MDKTRLTLLLALLIPATLAAGAPARAAPDVCNRYVDAYRKWLASQSDPTATANGPLGMAQAKANGVATVDPVGRFDDKGVARLADWAAAQKPPVQMPKSLTEKLVGTTSDGVTLEQAPGANYYAASKTAGTASCIASATFTIASGVASPAPAPASWAGSACGISRGFLRMNDAAVAYRDDTSFGPDLSARLSLAPWTGAGFGKACTIRFDYAPGFSTEHLLNEWETKCDDARCPALRRAAIDLVKDAKKDWKGLSARALARLPAADRARFSKDDLEARRESKDAPTDNDPLIILTTIDGAPYRVEIGHFTIGWRVFGDWKVSFATPDGKDVGSFGVGMGRGALTKTSVN